MDPQMGAVFHWCADHIRLTGHRRAVSEEERRAHLLAPRVEVDRLVDELARPAWQADGAPSYVVSEHAADASDARR